MGASISISIGKRRFLAIRYSQIALFLVLCAGGVMVVTPVLWMFSTSLKESVDTFSFPPQWIPTNPQWQNYVHVWTVLPFGRFFLNSSYITVLVVIGQLISSSLAAFGFSRLEFPGRDFWFMVAISTMMLPGVVTMIPVFVLFSRLGWIDTFKPLTVPAFFAWTFNVFLLRQFFTTIPRDLENAARIDGAGSFSIFVRIFLPLAKPALTAVAVLQAVGTWQDFMGPLIYLHSMEKLTLQVGLAFFKNIHYTQYNYLMAGSVVVMLPVLVLYFWAQRYFIEGITLTGMKG